MPKNQRIIRCLFLTFKLAFTRFIESPIFRALYNFLFLVIFILPISIFSEIRILCMGDSNTHGVPFTENGWVFKLKNDAELKQYDLKFENYAFGFATTSQCEQILIELFQHHKFDIAFYNCGLVDMLLKNPLDLVEASMDRSLTLCQKHVPIVFFGMIDFTCWLARRNENYEYLKKANNLFIEMAKKHPVIAYEFLTTDLLCHEKCNVGDWIHPNDFGTHLIFLRAKEGLLKVLKQKSSIKFDVLTEY